MKLSNKFDGDRLFFTADTHFNHTNMLKFCDRPFADVEEMNETIIARWNQVVGEEDHVFHLGDFCQGGSAEWSRLLDRLNGKIHLIVGNHDMKNLRQGYIKRFEEVVMQQRIEVEDKLVYWNHYPYLCFDGDTRKMCGSCSDMYIPGKTTPVWTQSGWPTSTLPSTMSAWIITVLLLYPMKR